MFAGILRPEYDAPNYANARVRTPPSRGPANRAQRYAAVSERRLNAVYDLSFACLRSERISVPGKSAAESMGRTVLVPRGPFTMRPSGTANE
jgi:hypothetical protein